MVTANEEACRPELVAADWGGDRPELVTADEEIYQPELVAQTRRPVG